MKRSTISRIFATCLIAVIFSMAGYSQYINAPWTEMSDSSRLSGPAHIDTVLEGSTMPYYVRPDAVLNNTFATTNTAYDPTATNTSQGINTEFEWGFKDANTGTGTPTITGPAGDALIAPYRTVQFSGNSAYTGADTLWVIETNPSASTCPGDTVKHIVTVLDSIKFTYTNAVATDTQEVCDGASFEVRATLTDNNVRGGYIYFMVDSTFKSVQPDLTTVINAYNSATTDSAYVTSMRSTAGVFADTAVVSGTLAAKGGNITIYNFGLKVNDKLSRKADFLTIPDADKSNPAMWDLSWYGVSATGDEAVARVYIVYPQPSTGAIYYVPNNFDAN